MKKAFSVLAAAGLLISTAILAESPPSASDLPRDLELELALSALPPHLRAEATVYVLGASRRFEVAQQGTNGFHTFVSRHDPNALLGDWLFTEYRDDILLPISFDDAGARAHMRVYLDMAELRAAGISAAEMKAVIKRRYETGYYQAPERVGISYMLAPVVRSYVDGEASDLVTTWNVPHYMIYAPGVTNQQIGGKFMSPYPYILNHSPGPHGYIIQWVGQEDKQAINEEYAEMIGALCKWRDLYCLPG